MTTMSVNVLEGTQRGCLLNTTSSLVYPQVSLPAASLPSLTLSCCANHGPGPLPLGPLGQSPVTLQEGAIVAREGGEGGCVDWLVTLHTHTHTHLSDLCCQVYDLHRVHFVC